LDLQPGYEGGSGGLEMGRNKADSVKEIDQSNKKAGVLHHPYNQIKNRFVF